MLVAALGRLGIRYRTGRVIMAHGTRLLMAAFGADENLGVQIEGAIGWLDLLKSQLATANVAV